MTEYCTDGSHLNTKHTQTTKIQLMIRNGISPGLLNEDNLNPSPKFLKRILNTLKIAQISFDLI